MRDDTSANDLTNLGKNIFFTHLMYLVETLENHQGVTFETAYMLMVT